MVKDNNKKKKVITIVISIIIILLLVLAISYAYFSTQLNGTDQIVKVGELELVLDETSEGINIDNVVGISDEEGLGSTPSTFELRNNGDKAVDYTIYLDDNTIGDTDTRIDDMYLKYNLNKNGSDSGGTLLTKIGSNPNRVLDTGTIAGGETNKYSLNLWITDEVDGNYSGQVFSGKLRVEVSQERAKEASTVLLENIPKENQYDDGVDTFITGENPNNYIWYSGKLWRAVSINNEEKTVKLVTQWNISVIPYADDSSAFEGSYMEQWLNDTTVDGFLGNLRDYDKFIVTDAKWNATQTTSANKPPETTMVELSVGLLNYYEYTTSYRKADSLMSYLNNGLYWWTLTPYSINSVININYLGSASSNTGSVKDALGIRPSINLKSNVKIVSGDGTEENPYRLEGDNDSNLSGSMLNTRYSGEYVQFGDDGNNLYRIVSHETEGLTKITSVEPLKESDTFKTINFGDYANYSFSNDIGVFLNEEYLDEFLLMENRNLLNDNTTWYLGAVDDQSNSNYILAKYSDVNMNELTSNITQADVGLLRLGEQMAGQFNSYDKNENYWLITPRNVDVRAITIHGYAGSSLPSTLLYGIKPALNLKSNVIITSGDGTKENPFQIELAS